MDSNAGTVGIVVGGGPAPGINGVISSITIEAINSGMNVLGFYDGFKHLSAGEKVFENLFIDKVTRINQIGGSILRTSRVNPTRDRGMMENVVKTLIELGVTHLATIGGDDTSFTSREVSEFARVEMGFDLKVVHVPKTIDNDLPLPEGIPTFGFQTARALGAEEARNLSEDARTTSRWYVVVVMGRSAGHLPLGVGKGSGATLTLIPEEFKGPIRLSTIADIIAAAIAKRLSRGKSFGLACLAEGLAERISADDPEFLKGIERDAHGHVRLGEVPFAAIVKKETARVVKEIGIDMSFVHKDIGYELRCAHPIAADVEYTMNLGFGAVSFLREGGSHALISIQNNRVVPIPFDEIMERETGRIGVRLVNVDSVEYRAARRFMIRLERSDLDDPQALMRIASVTNLQPSEFKERFGYIVDEVVEAG